jgi:hypothetical protein
MQNARPLRLLNFLRIFLESHLQLQRRGPELSLRGQAGIARDRGKG